MPALAYVLLPVSGIIAYVKGTTAEVRWHGLQAVVLGAVWPVLLYASTWIDPVVTQVLFGIGLLTWLVLMAGAAFDRGIRLPVVGAWLHAVAETSVLDDPLSAEH
ncbi:MAG: hypothetical protein M3P18_14455 [Actinomycetota bacterium]|nr:hypothetical protein [Actinomycetota bacterium]